MKSSGLSTGGLGGSADRSLGDVLQVKTGLHGQAIVTYLDDTAAGRNIDVTDNPITEPSGEDPPEASGPIGSATQIADASPCVAMPSTGSAAPPTDR